MGNATLACYQIYRIIIPMNKIIVIPTGSSGFLTFSHSSCRALLKQVECSKHIHLRKQYSNFSNLCKNSYYLRISSSLFSEMKPLLILRIKYNYRIIYIVYYVFIEIKSNVKRLQKQLYSIYSWVLECLIFICDGKRAGIVETPLCPACQLSLFSGM